LTGVRRSPRLLLAGLAMLGICLAGCSSNTTSVVPPDSDTGTTQTTTATTATTEPVVTVPAAKGLVWVLTAKALASVAADAKALAVLESGTIYEIVPARQSPVAGVNAVITDDFASYGTMSAAVQDNTLVPGTKALLYDPERWAFTPLEEQQDVVKYIGDAVSLAHQHGLQIIVTPALDLVLALAPGTASGREVTEFFALGVEQAAAAADVVDIQAQSREHNPTLYATFVLKAASVIHAARPEAIVIAGLSTDPETGAVTAGTLAAAIDSVKNAVQGYWLNMPKKGAICPGCGTDTDPAAGIGALDEVWG
jgi:hypothetical protein